MRHFLEMCEFSINYCALNILLNVSLNSVCKYAGLLSQLMMWQFRCDILAIFDIHLHTCNIIFYFIFSLLPALLPTPLAVCITRTRRQWRLAATVPNPSHCDVEHSGHVAHRVGTVNKIQEVNVEYSIISIYSSAVQPFSITYQSGTQTTLEFR